MGYSLITYIYFGYKISKDDEILCKLLYNDYINFDKLRSKDIDDFIHHYNEADNYYNKILYLCKENGNLDLGDGYSINIHNDDYDPDLFIVFRSNEKYCDSCYYNTMEYDNINIDKEDKDKFFKKFNKNCKIYIISEML